MNIALQSTEVTRIYAVTGAPPVPLRYRESQIIPERVSVEFRDGGWIRVTIGGPRAKKDGWPSAAYSDTTFYASEAKWAPVPDWAVAFTEFDFVPAGE